MRRWNGWGDEATVVELPANGAAFLAGRIGAGQPLPDASLEQVLARVPASRLAAHPLISLDAETRVRHARGQSLPDWLAMREGDFGQFPDGVAFPETPEQIRQLLALAAERDLVLIPYGGGTSVAGHINPQAGERPVLTLSLAHMNRLLELDEDSLIATFGPGASGPQVESQLRARGYTLGHFPQSWELSTLGGWVASRSSGQQSLRYGRIEQLFAGGTLETFAGPMELPTFPASAAGPDLRELVLGSEGRFGVISEVRVRVSRLAEQESFYAVFLPSWEQALSGIRHLAQARVPLSMLRLSNAIETETQLALAGHPGQIALLEKYLALRGAGGWQVHADLRRHRQPDAERRLAETGQAPAEGLRWRVHRHLAGQEVGAQPLPLPLPAPRLVERRLRGGHPGNRHRLGQCRQPAGQDRGQSAQRS
ncbi:hypothetical protein PCA10_20950 [Metapseudomonas resinovorans NBRC 106553]|uniref:FAD-binding PCMH-type domain-containing protein n=1 Tax=Metapseudomonas resinovorans NBRC 106553 TaxID=1245471 RepID=S6AE61_METRE|nr:hypothetical protein PCA10_20950 [Pseudomonas resinovorans NBRC 106553]